MQKTLKYIVLILITSLASACTQQDWLTVSALLIESSNRKPIQVDTENSAINYPASTPSTVSYKRSGDVIYGSDGSVCKIVYDNIFCY